MVLNGTCPTVFVMGTSYISINWYRIFHSSYLFTAARSATLLFVFTFFFTSSIDVSLVLRLYDWQFLVCNCFRGLFLSSITADIPYSSQFVHRINFCNIFSPLFCCFWVLNYYHYGHWRFRQCCYNGEDCTIHILPVTCQYWQYTSTEITDLTTRFVCVMLYRQNYITAKRTS